MGWACGTYGEEKRFIRGFGGGSLMERDHLSDVGVHGIIILKRIFKESYKF